MDYRELIREACAKACESDRRSGLDKLIRQKCADAIRSIDLDKIVTRPEPVGIVLRTTMEDEPMVNGVKWLIPIKEGTALYAEPVAAPRPEPVAWAAYWPDGGLCRLDERYQGDLQSSKELGLRFVPLYTALVAAPSVPQELAERAREAHDILNMPQTEAVNLKHVSQTIRDCVEFCAGWKP